MKYPDLVPTWVCTTPISLTIEGEGVTEEGAPPTTTEISAYCNWQDGGETIYSGGQKVVEITGKAYFHGDICPTIPNITAGTGTIDGELREIHRGYKRRNPDGTVNHTEITFK